MDEKTITIIRVVIIFLSLSGYGTLLKRNLKIPTNFIPIILFSGVMIIEYFSALIGLLPIITNIVYLLGLIISFRYLFEFILNFRKILFKKRKKSTRFNIQIKFVHPKLIIKKYLSLIKSKVNKSFQEGLSIKIKK